MNYIILIILAGLNISPFIFLKMNIWLAQGFWCHIGISSLFALSLIQKPKNEDVKNIPLFLLFSWVAFLTSVICYNVLIQNKYDIQHFFQYFNLFCVIIFYKFVIQHQDENLIKYGKLVFKYTILFNLFIALFQLLGVSQYFKLLFPNHNAVNNIVTGMIGNGTHLSGFLALCSPVLFTKKREDVLVLIFMILMMCFMGTTVGEPALNGFVILICSFLFYVFHINKKVFLYSIGGLFFVFVLLFFLISSDYRVVLLQDNGRVGLWAQYLPIMKDNFITGVGLGSINLIAPKTSIPNAFHMHLEYYHFLIELGIIGLILIINVIHDFFKVKTTEENLVFKTIVFGFLISCFFTYPAHLWFSAMFTIFAYAIVKGNHGRLNAQTNS